MNDPIHLVTPEDYAAERPAVFPSTDSLRWFERQHRKELIECGALVMPTGRKLVNPQAFDSAVMAIGKRLMAARSASK